MNAKPTPDALLIGDVSDTLCKAINLADLLELAATGLFHSGNKAQGEALLTGVCALTDELKSAKQMLYRALGDEVTV